MRSLDCNIRLGGQDLYLSNLFFIGFVSTPIGHFFSSIPICTLFAKHLSEKKWPIYLLAPLLTCIHDVSYPLLKLTGFDLGHREITHSLILAIPFSLLSGWLFKCLYQSFRLGLTFGLVCFCSHIFLDMAASLTGPMIFYPFSQQRIDLPFHFMPVAEPRIGSITFNTTCVVYEMIIFTSITCLIKNKFRILSSLILLLVMVGSIRQSNFRSYIWFEAPKDHLEHYLETLDDYSPLYFSFFIEGNPESGKP